MTVPRFLDRIVDAAAPVLGGLGRDAVTTKLEASAVTLVAGEVLVGSPEEAGFLLAANLAARLYPRIGLLGDEEVVRKATDQVTLVNPSVEVETSADDSIPTLAYEATAGSGMAVAVAARGWNVYVDRPRTELGEIGATVPAAMLAAVVGIGELFRIVFAEELGTRGRSRPTPAGFNLVTLDEPRDDLPVKTDVMLGEFRLVGAGAIGQAAASTLASARARGTLIAVDAERVELSNLQRYVLTRDADVGAVKVDLLRERLASSDIDVVPEPCEWHAGLADEPRPTLVALDSAEARIGVQASLPGVVYNAWTQPADVGWSRHESFGVDPCLACLYWPDHPVASRHEQIAAAFHQHPLRVLAYLVHRNIPIGSPLPAGGLPLLPGLEAPPETSAAWLATPIIEDIAAEAGIDVAVLAEWRERSLADVYQDGICGGALLPLNVGSVPREVLVPLAHQSAFAGVMLATEMLIAAIPELRQARNASPEGRFDVLAPPNQVLARPRARTDGCICSDAVFVDVYSHKVQKRDRSNKRRR